MLAPSFQLPHPSPAQSFPANININRKSCHYIRYEPEIRTLSSPSEEKHSRTPNELMGSNTGQIKTPFTLSFFVRFQLCSLADIDRS